MDYLKKLGYIPTEIEPQHDHCFHTGGTFWEPPNDRIAFNDIDQVDVACRLVEMREHKQRMPMVSDIIGHLLNDGQYDHLATEYDAENRGKQVWIYESDEQMMSEVSDTLKEALDAKDIDGMLELVAFAFASAQKFAEVCAETDFETEFVTMNCNGDFEEPVPKLSQEYREKGSTYKLGIFVPNEDE